MILVLRIGLNLETGWGIMIFHCGDTNRSWDLEFLLLVDNKQHSVISTAVFPIGILPHISKHYSSLWNKGTLVVTLALFPLGYSSDFSLIGKCSHLACTILESYYPHWNEEAQFHATFPTVNSAPEHSYCWP